MIFPASVSFFANFWCKIGILVLVVLLILRFKKLYFTCSAFTLLFFLGFRTFRSFEKIISDRLPPAAVFEPLPYRILSTSNHQGRKHAA